MLGYGFRRAGLLEEALTSPSYRMCNPDVKDNQRLEFLGDAVLQILASEVIYSEFPDEAEGNLTMRRQHMVSTPVLCGVAEKAGLAERIRFNKHEPIPKYTQKVFADVIEALIGAAYLDGGLEAARGVFKSLGLDKLGREEPWAGNPKGALQVMTQAMVPPRRPEYRLVAVAGKSHEPEFTIEVFVEGLGTARAIARTRKEAEAMAAAELLKKGDK